jgi:two-component system chemotaxis response regulator CheY
MKKVILVDDSKTVVATAQMALDDLIDKKMIIFKSYTNPLDFLNNINQNLEDFDLLISDINMPQMNGLDLTAEIKANPKFHNKPVLILTTESSADMKNKGKALGVTGWMVKPFSDDKLVKSIKMVLGI